MQSSEKWPTNFFSPRPSPFFAWSLIWLSPQIMSLAEASQKNYSNFTVQLGNTYKIQIIYEKETFLKILKENHMKYDN